MDKAAIFFNEAIFSCSESTLHNIVEEQQSECARRYESVHENLKMGLAATMVLSLIGTVLNGVMMVTVCRDQVSDSYNHVDIVIGEYFISETWLKILFLRGFHTQLHFIFISQYEKSLHDSWVLMIYFAMFLCFVAVILMPFAFFLWTTVRSMRQYRDLVKASREGTVTSE